MASHYSALKGDYTKNLAKIIEKKLGTSCFNFLEENQMLLFVLTQILLVLEAKRIMGIHVFRNHCIDYAFVLTPAIKGFEGYLKKLIREQDLWQRDGDDIGVVFGGKKSDKVYTKLRDDDYNATPKVILAEWINCRNRTLHYNKRFFVKSIEEATQIFRRILEIMKESYEAYVEDSSYVQPRSIFTPASIKPKEEISIDDLRRKIGH
jgi:hypothetical protein